jgi:hypothetical protein
MRRLRRNRSALQRLRPMHLSVQKRHLKPARRSKLELHLKQPKTRSLIRSLGAPVLLKLLIALRRQDIPKQDAQGLLGSRGHRQAFRRPAREHFRLAFDEQTQLIRALLDHQP